MFEALADDPDMEYASERCHDCPRPSPWSWRKRGTKNQAIGKSKGGWITKILALTDALGNLIEIDKEIYKWRHLIENFFCIIQDYKAIAMRCEKKTEISPPLSISVQL